MLLAGITHPSKRDQWVFWLLDVDNNVCGRLTRSGIAQNRTVKVLAIIYSSQLSPSARLGA